MVDAAERDSFIESNLPLVHSLCRRFTGRGIEYDDLFQMGCLGLVKAADGFDESRGLCFSTYAVPVILGEIRRMFRDGGSVKVSRSLKELSLKAVHVKASLELKLSREPTVSLTYESDDGVCEADVAISGPEDLLTDRLLLQRAFAYLDDTEQQIIRCRYFEYLTQNETAARMGMSQVQISRAEKKILLKLRAAIGSVA